MFLSCKKILDFNKFSARSVPGTKLGPCHFCAFAYIDTRMRECFPPTEVLFYFFKSKHEGRHKKISDNIEKDIIHCKVRALFNTFISHVRILID